LRTIVPLAIAFEGGLFVVALGLGWLLDTPALATLRVTWRAAGLGVLATVPPLLLMWWLLRTTWAPITRLNREIEHTVAPLFAGSTPVQLAVVAVAAGLGEEVLFRGVVQEALIGWSGPAIGLLATSLLFGLVHLITPTYAALAGLLGLYLGALALYSGNLLAPVLVHALYDLVALTYWVGKPPAAA
jgi:membrane protease YdiL (CAAX protease family)